MRTHLVRRMLIASALTTIALGSTTPASAHEGRKIGRYEFVVGWGSEPAYAGFQNSVQVRIEDHAAEKPVTSSVALQAEIIFGSEKKTLPLEPNFRAGVFGDEGDYRAWIVPTRPGTYTFHIIGSVAGQKIDATFTSSETTFDDLKDPSEVQFPVKDPSNGELAARVDREVPRLEAQIKALTARARDAEETASLSRTFGIAGIGAGVLGLTVAILATRRRRAG